MLEKILSALLIFLRLAVLSLPVENEIVKKSENYHYTEYLTLTNQYPHNTESFTQGLFFHNGEMYESTGRYGESMLYGNIEIESGTAEKQYSFPEDIFAEGAVVFKDKLYVLTYKENQVQIFDPETLELETTYSYPRQGWGLTTDGEWLIASDGSSNLYFMDEELKVSKTVEVNRDGERVERINELEYINGEIWANVWLTNEIIVINKDNGEVLRTIDFSQLNAMEITDNNNVFNGIAYNSENGKLYLTGKKWDTLYEFEFKME